MYFFHGIHFHDSGARDQNNGRSSQLWLMLPWEYCAHSVINYFNQRLPKADFTENVPYINRTPTTYKRGCKPIT